MSGRRSESRTRVGHDEAGAQKQKGTRWRSRVRRGEDYGLRPMMVAGILGAGNIPSSSRKEEDDPVQCQCACLKVKHGTQPAQAPQAIYLATLTADASFLSRIARRHLQYLCLQSGLLTWGAQ